MPECTTKMKDELARLEDRVRGLSTEKSYLQLITAMMKKLCAVAGLPNIVEGIVL
ncbi:MAG: hypothetical protein HQK96_19030, partial [Nitrospirae bacterium]|nr:hypothetical protein [Nitrospirota bacterium]